MTPKAILFDLDGTLMDDESAVTAALRDWGHEQRAAEWRRLLDVHFGRYQRGEVAFAEQRRCRVREFLDRPALAAAEADAIFADYERAYQAAWRAFDDAAPALARWSPLPCAVLTNGDASQQRAKLRATGLLPSLADVFASSEIGAAKPDARAFHHACSALGVAPGECLFVGDHREKDAAGSAGAGLVAVWLDRGRSGQAPPPGARRIHTLDEL